jgi:beta-glucosidase
MSHRTLSSIDRSKIIVRASSVESDALGPMNVVDSYAGSRWGSAWSEPQWLEIDLGSAIDVSSIGISWDAARATHHTISVSADGKTWEPAAAFADRSPSDRFDEAAFASPKAVRLVRIDCRRRYKQDYGFSITQIWIDGDKLTVPEPDVPAEAQDAPFRDVRRTPEQRAKDLAARLTFDELARLTGGFAGFFIAPLRRFGLPAVAFTDASMGIRFNDEAKWNKSTSFPALVGLAATFCPELAHAYAKSVGEQCRAHGIGTLLGPGVNIYRTSMCGRSFEYMGEDPHLTSRMAVEYVKGMQSTGVMACIKHFACNNNEWIRHDVNVKIDDRAFHEIYLPAFRAAVEEAGVMALMTSYNHWNGEKASQNKALIDGVLRRELGFKGLVMSDWGAVRDGEKAIASGQDLVMPDNGAVRTHVKEHPEKHDEIETQLRRMAESILSANFRMGFYDRPQADRSLLARYGAHEAIALRTAHEAVTLLKNGGVLPIEGKQTILVTGPAGEKTQWSGGGSGWVMGYDHVTYLAGLRAVYGDLVTYRESPTDDEIRQAGIVIACPWVHEAEGLDRWFELPEDQETLVRRAVRLNRSTVVVVTEGGGIQMTGWANEANAIVFAYYLGQRGGTALADVLSGKVNPSGKLPFTIEKRFTDSPASRYLPDFVLESRDPVYLGDDPPTLAALATKGITVPHALRYDESIFVGYRWYEHENIEPMFSFGHGLSYTTFAYGDLSTKVDGHDVEVSFTIENTGKRAGKETAQVYVADRVASVPRPNKELKAFAKVDLLPGEKKTVTLTLRQDAFAFWDGGWKVEPGVFTILIGASSADVKLQADVTL